MLIQIAEVYGMGDYSTRRNKMKTTHCLTVILISLFATNAFAGWAFLEDRKGEKGTVIQENKITFKAPDEILSFDLEKDMITVISPAEKKYWSGTTDAFEAGAKKSIESIEKLIEQQLPEGQGIFRPESATKASVEVKDTGEVRKIAGHPARKYEIFVDGDLKQEKWIAEDIDVGKDLDIAKFKKMMGKFQSAFGRDQVSEALWSDKATAMLDKGWPLAIVDYRSDIDKHTDETVKVEQKDIPKSEFAPPPGFKSVTFDDVFGK